MIIATHPAGATASPIGVTRDGVVYELFFTALPALGFTAADVVKLYLHRGSFETVLADEDREQDSDRWSSYTTAWSGNLANSCPMDLEPAPRTQPAVATDLDASHRVCPPLTLNRCHLRTASADWAILRSPAVGACSASRKPGRDRTFFLRLMARCVVGKGPRSIRRNDAPNTMGRVRVLYAARIADCRSCPLRIPCQGHGTSTQKPRRVSAVLHPLPQPAPEEPPPSCLAAPHPILWGDWSRCSASPRLDTVATQPPGHGGSPTRFTTSLHACTALARSARALALDVATTARTQCATTQRPACRDYRLWALHGVCPGSGFAKSLELTARARRSSSSTWFLPSSRSVCPFSHPGIRWITLFAIQQTSPV